MDASQFRNNVLQKIERIKNEVHPLAVISTHGTMLAVRIFERGEDVTGKTYQYNDSKEIWVSDRTSPVGSRNQGKTGRAQKTSVFASYKKYRGDIGRETSQVNFRLTNELQLDFLSTIRAGEGGRVVSGVKSEHNFKKLEGLEQKYGAKIFTPNEAERANIRRLIAEGAAKIWNE